MPDHAMPAPGPPEPNYDSTCPVLHVVVVGFHHKKGCQVLVLVVVVMLVVLLVELLVPMLLLVVYVLLVDVVATMSRWSSPTPP